jgi:hypothetical protein
MLTSSPQASAGSLTEAVNGVVASGSLQSSLGSLLPGLTSLSQSSPTVVDPTINSQEGGSGGGGGLPLPIIAGAAGGGALLVLAAVFVALRVRGGGGFGCQSCKSSEDEPAKTRTYSSHNKSRGPTRRFPDEAETVPMMSVNLTQRSTSSDMMAQSSLDFPNGSAARPVVYDTAMAGAAPRAAVSSRNPAATGSQREPAEKYCVVLFDYSSGSSNELSVTQGERLVVLSQDASGWAQVRRGREAGWIPTSFLDFASPAAKAPNAPQPSPQPSTLAQTDSSSRLQPQTQERNEAQMPHKEQTALRRQPSKEDITDVAVTSADKSEKHTRVVPAAAMAESLSRDEKKQSKVSAAARRQESVQQHAHPEPVEAWPTGEANASRTGPVGLVTNPLAAVMMGAAAIGSQKAVRGQARGQKSDSEDDPSYVVPITAVAAAGTPKQKGTQQPLSQAALSPTPIPAPTPMFTAKDLATEQADASVEESPYAEAADWSENLYRAKFAFAGANEEELDLAEGDYVTVIEQGSGGWWAGHSEGRSGWFPCAFVEPVQVFAAVRTPADTYEQPDPDVSPYATADLLQPAAEEVEHFYTAVTAEESIYSEINTDGAQEEEPFPPPPPLEAALAVQKDAAVVARFEYTASSETELSLSAGDVVTVAEVGDGWIYGECRGRTGWLPSTFVQPAVVAGGALTSLGPVPEEDTVDLYESTTDPDDQHRGERVRDNVGALAPSEFTAAQPTHSLPVSSSSGASASARRAPQGAAQALAEVMHARKATSEDGSRPISIVGSSSDRVSVTSGGYARRKPPPPGVYAAPAPIQNATAPVPTSAAKVTRPAAPGFPAAGKPEGDAAHAASAQATGATAAGPPGIVFKPYSTLALAKKARPPPPGSFRASDTAAGQTKNAPAAQSPVQTQAASTGNGRAPPVDGVGLAKPAKRATPAAARAPVRAAPSVSKEALGRTEARLAAHIKASTSATTTATDAPQKLMPKRDAPTAPAARKPPPGPAPVRAAAADIASVSTPTPIVERPAAAAVAAQPRLLAARAPPALPKTVESAEQSEARPPSPSVPPLLPRVVVARDSAQTLVAAPMSALAARAPPPVAKVTDSTSQLSAESSASRPASEPSKLVAVRAPPSLPLVSTAHSSTAAEPLAAAAAAAAMPIPTPAPAASRLQAVRAAPTLVPPPGDKESVNMPASKPLAYQPAEDTPLAPSAPRAVLQAVRATPPPPPLLPQPLEHATTLSPQTDTLAPAPTAKASPPTKPQRLLAVRAPPTLPPNTAGAVESPSVLIAPTSSTPPAASKASSLALDAAVDQPKSSLAPQRIAPTLPPVVPAAMDSKPQPPEQTRASAAEAVRAPVRLAPALRPSVEASAPSTEPAAVEQSRPPRPGRPAQEDSHTSAAAPARPPAPTARDGPARPPPPSGGASPPPRPTAPDRGEAGSGPARPPPPATASTPARPPPPKEDAAKPARPPPPVETGAPARPPPPGSKGAAKAETETPRRPPPPSQQATPAPARPTPPARDTVAPKRPAQASEPAATAKPAKTPARPTSPAAAPASSSGKTKAKAAARADPPREEEEVAKPKASTKAKAESAAAKTKADGAGAKQTKAEPPAAAAAGGRGWLADPAEERFAPPAAKAANWLMDPAEERFAPPQGGRRRGW